MCDLRGEARRAYESGEGWEPILQHLRAQGCNIIDCIKIVRDVTGCSLRDAKILVSESHAWSDQRAKNEEFHEQLFKWAEEWTDAGREVEHTDE